MKESKEYWNGTECVQYFNNSEVKEKTKYVSGKKIIALDFDGVVVTSVWPETGTPIMKNVEAIKKEIEAGTRVILWTCRTSLALMEAMMICQKLGIRLAAVNENLPEILAMFPTDSRKILADEYWDDKAVLKNDQDERFIDLI
jgi:hypothetical protein